MTKLKLEQVLKSKGLSKRQFSKMLGMDYSNVFRFFRPDFDPKLSTLDQWANALGVRIRDLFEEVKLTSNKD